MQPEIRKLIYYFTTEVREFAINLYAAAKQDAKAEIMRSLSQTKLHPALVAAAKPPRRKGPIQLCPFPRCKNRAAPVYGMVCGDHKDVPKAKIAKYREARRKRVSAGRRA